MEDITAYIWQSKYRDATDTSIEDTWRRVARSLATVEAADASGWEERFYRALEDFRFLPGGRILAGAGTPHEVTLFNCFVMGVIDDSMEGIFTALKEGALTLQQGGGIGYDFSSLRPRGSIARHTGTQASGPVSFMQVWDSMCATLLSTGSRRGAMMATLRCDHPDIEEFIDAKQQQGALRNFNLSVQISDAFMRAVRDDASWPLVFPAASLADEAGATVKRAWTGQPAPIPCRVVRSLSARALWQKLLRAAYDYAEPGVLFVDQINRENNLRYREQITATNPCGEIPLPPYGACDLGSINLVRFVRAPFGASAAFDFDALVDITCTATRMLDNVIDASRFPLPAHQAMARGSRRIGLGLTGLADALVMLGLPYGSPESLRMAGDIMRILCHTAYRTSINLAREKGVFPFFDKARYLESPFIRRLPADLQAQIARYGIRNSHLLAVAPTGTISLLAGNVSSSLEPVYAAHQRRAVRAGDTIQQFDLVDYAVRAWREHSGDAAGVPPALVRAQDVDPHVHLQMQAVLQAYVDNAISKTINIPEHTPFAAFENVYTQAYDLGLKGCTTYRPNPVRGAVLEMLEEQINAPHCCTLEREAD